MKSLGKVIILLTTFTVPLCVPLMNNTKTYISTTTNNNNDNNNNNIFICANSILYLTLKCVKN